MILASLSQTTRRRYATILGALGTFMPCAYAQKAPVTAQPSPTAAQLAKYDANKNGVLDADELATLTAEEKSAAIVLTPFEVNTSQDRGFAAGNTLSGGRVNTPLELSPSSIQVITKEFIEDFAITDFLDAAKWTMNVDPPSSPNQAPFGTDRFEINVRSANGQGNIPMRDGIPQYSIADSYNSERFEVVSGPNSGMAGLGNSGGVTGSSSKKARFNSRSGSVITRVDSFDGYRGTLDYNLGLDRVAIRLNALHQNEKSIQNGTSKKMNAITLRADFKLTAKTIVSAQYERSAEWNTQYRNTYGDQQSFWDRTTFNLDNSALPTTPAGQIGTGLSRIAGNNGLNDRLTYNFSTKSVINYTGNQYQTSGTGYQIPWKGNPYVPTEWFGGANMIRSFGKDFWLGPVDNFADRDVSSKRVTIDHIFSPNLTARLVWQSHESDPVTYWGDFSVPGDVRVDVNRLLPNGTANPNYLRRYSEWGAGGSQYQEDSRDVYNAEVSYNFRLPRFFDLKQNFSGIYSYLDGTYSAWTRTWRRNNNPAQLDPLNGVNALTFRTYYGDPQPRVQPIITQAALNALMPGTTWGNYGSGWHADSIKDGRNAAIYSTTSFLQDRLVISGNFRRDKILNSDLNGININGRANDPLNNYRKYIGQVNPVTKLAEEGYAVKTNASLDSFGLGTVITPFPARWGAWLSPIKFVANYSENNREPSPGGPFYTGESPGAPFSSTTDYAVRFSIPGGKVYGEVRRYFTTNTGNIAGMSNQTDIQNIWRNLGFTSGGDTYDFSTNAYRDINDRDLTGTEIELVANPTNNWTLRVNYAHPRVQTVIDRPYLSRYFAEHQAEWRAGALLPDGATVPGTNRVILSQAAIVQAITNIENGLNGLTPGTIGNGPLHRGTVATTYRFREGTLKGVGLSAGVSWRGQAKAGSRDARLKFQTTAPTIAQSKAAAYDYLWVPSQMTNNVGINYARRFGKYSARFQLNITNILNDDDPQWTGYSTINAGQLTNQNDSNALTVAGSNPRMQVLSGFFQQEPRKFVFTTTLNF